MYVFNKAYLDYRGALVYTKYVVLAFSCIVYRFWKTCNAIVFANVNAAIDSTSWHFVIVFIALSFPSISLNLITFFRYSYLFWMLF